MSVAIIAPRAPSQDRDLDRGSSSPKALLSEAGGGAAYKTATGFLEPYGDCGELAITSTSRSIAIWGEGASYNGPGGVWFDLAIQ